MPGELLVTLSHHAAESCWYLASKLHPGRVAADGWKAVLARKPEPAKEPR
jgi:hypothetical protein